jgi:hypothetical protein
MRNLIAGALIVSAFVAADPRGVTSGAGPDVLNTAGIERSGAGTALFDGVTLKGWNGDPAIWSVKDGAIHGVSETGSQLILSDGEYSDFRLILKSRLLSASNHLGVCFWGERKADWGYGECILVIPPTGHFWDYHPGMSDDPAYEKFAHPDLDPHVWHETEILARRRTGIVRVAVNGVEVTRYTDKNSTRLKKGPVGLQIHSGASEVEYKDIDIEVDPKEDRLVTVRAANDHE